MKFSMFRVSFALALAVPVVAQTVPARPQITGISHISIYSADMAKSDHFYVHDLGGVKMSDPEDGAAVRYYFSPVQFVEVAPLPAGETSISRLSHVGYRTSDAEQMRTYLAAHGVSGAGKVEHGADGSVWFEVSDPEGNHVQFVQPPAHPPAVPANPLSSHIIHVGYMVHNDASENGFYEAILGFRPMWYGGSRGKIDWISHQVPEGRDWVEYMITHAPEQTGIPASMTRAGLGSMDHFSLGVQNMEKAVELLYAGDRMDPKNGPKIGADGKWQFNAFDPDQTRAEIMEFQPVVKPCCSPFTAPSPTE